MSWVKQVHLTTLQTIRHPKKRRSTAELGRFASRARLVLNVFLVPNKLGYGGLASLFEARGAVGPPI